MQIVKPNTRYPFIGRRKPFLVLSLLLVAIGLASPFIIAPNWGTSFSGGSSIIVHFEEEVTIEEVRSAFASHGEEYADVSVQAYGGGDTSSYMIKTRKTTAVDCGSLSTLKDALPKGLAAAGVAGVEIDSWPGCEGEGVRGDFFVRLAPIGEPREGLDDLTDPLTGVSTAMMEKVVRDTEIDAFVTFEKSSRRFVVKPLGLQAEVTKLLVDSFGEKFDPNTGLDTIVTVGPDVGAKFRNDGIVSILVALGLILLYIAIRFDVRYAPGAVVALIHDVIITFGVIVLTQMEISLETVAALLAIVGYSLNDTIVTFDRIRENIAGDREGTIAEVVNISINECLSRTILTSLTTLFAVAALATIGNGIIRDFATTLVIGVAIGTYSSIFVASPVMLWMDGVMEKRKARLAVREKLEQANPTT